MTANSNLNYQQIYEEQLSDTLKESLEKSSRFFELSHQDRMLVEELVDIGYRMALQEALDPEVLQDTAALAGEMGTQLYNFANLIQAYLNDQNSEDEN
tara:strand:- start:2281 stop:2574 length:294 start_codon:yes stop_codon:yes gene_type:complete